MYKTPLFINEALQSVLILVGVVAFAGVIVLAVILFKKKFKKFDIEKPDISEEQAVQEELNRILVDVDEELVEKPKDEPKQD